MVSGLSPQAVAHGTQCLNSLERLTLKGCCFKHEFPGQDGNIPNQCGDNSKWIDCGHSKDLALHAALAFLNQSKIINDDEHSRLRAVLEKSRKKLDGLDNQAAGLSTVLMSLEGIITTPVNMVIEETDWLEGTGLELAAVIKNPASLRTALENEQRTNSEAKIAIKNASVAAIRLVLQGQEDEAIIIMRRLAIEAHTWLTNSPSNQSNWPYSQRLDK